jgi:glycosyltransferase involved in cell wall biosynthesis
MSSERITNRTGETPRVVVAVCTRDRAQLLRDVVEAVRPQLHTHPDRGLLIVDNGSSDGTAAYLEAMQREDARCAAVFEPQRGLYHARVAAIRAAANAEFLLFIDDDALPAPGWLDGVLDTFRSDPRIGVVGAAIDGAPEGPLPAWMSPRLQREIPFLPTGQGLVDGRFPCYPPGVSLAIRMLPCTMLYLAPERRRVELGPGGGAISGLSVVYGDDTDLCDIYARSGYRVVTNNAIRVRHRVVPEKLTLDWIGDRFEREGRLRIRLLRLSGRSLLGGHALKLLAALPALAALRVIAALGSRERTLLIRAYFRKSLGAWRELISGPRGIRFPYR